MRNYLIKVTDENGRQTFMKTGISKWFKPGYLGSSIRYYQECNPTKRFELV